MFTRIIKQLEKMKTYSLTEIGILIFDTRVCNFGTVFKK